MSGSGQPNGKWVSAALARAPLALMVLTAALMVAGCGNDASSTATLPGGSQQNSPTLVGTVQAPNGELAAAVPRGWWPTSVGLVAPAYALLNVLTVGEGIPVTLARVDPVDAADGVIGNTLGYLPQRLAADAFTDFEGKYKFVAPAANDFEVCRLMVSVGGDNARMRAFVFSGNTDVDAISETVVRVVLERLTRAPAVQLCNNFSLSSLQNIYDAVEGATRGVSGNSVTEIDQKAFEAAMTSGRVRQAIDAATGLPVN